jgi:hypothetical protein
MKTHQKEIYSIKYLNKIIRKHKLLKLFNYSDSRLTLAVTSESR